MLTDFEFFPELSSTSDYLKERDLPTGYAIQAGYQSAGRGRQGRAWLTPPDSHNLMLSLTFDVAGEGGSPPPLSLIPLITGSRLAKLIHRAKFPGAPSRNPPWIKWPNDLFLNDGKLGGILVESSATGGGENHPRVIIGIGINIDSAPDLPTKTEKKITDQAPATSLLAPGHEAPAKVRDDLAKKITRDLRTAFLPLSRPGAAAHLLPRLFEEEYDYIQNHFWLRGKFLVAGDRRGVCMGISRENGALILAEDGDTSRPREIISGDIQWQRQS